MSERSLGSPRRSREDAQKRVGKNDVRPPLSVGSGRRLGLDLAEGLTVNGFGQLALSLTELAIVSYGVAGDLQIDTLAAPLSWNPGDVYRLAPQTLVGQGDAALGEKAFRLPGGPYLILCIAVFTNTSTTTASRARASVATADGATTVTLSEVAVPEALGGGALATATLVDVGYFTSTSSANLLSLRCSKPTSTDIELDHATVMALKIG